MANGDNIIKDENVFKVELYLFRKSLKIGKDHFREIFNPKKRHEKFIDIGT